MKIPDKLNKLFALFIVLSCIVGSGWVYALYIYNETKNKKENDCQYFQNYEICKKS